jgi:predicted transcriptional regulator
MVHNGYMSTERGATPITIRFPPEVAGAIRHLAQEHDRSLDGEVVRAVREYIARQQQRKREGEQR